MSMFKISIQSVELELDPSEAQTHRILESLRSDHAERVAAIARALPGIIEAATDFIDHLNQAPSKEHDA